jgi:hypothetical protein
MSTIQVFQVESDRHYQEIFREEGSKMDYNEPLHALELWYASVCDGDWEHTYGIKIGTLDNPGWAIDIDLFETSLEGKHLERVIIDRTEEDWVQYWVENGVFKGRGGVKNLSEMLRLFADWKAAHTS